MAIVRTIIDRLMVRAHNAYDSRPLRRYFEKQYGIRVGLYTIGAFDRWRVPPNSVVGRYCSIAKSSFIADANHPLSALSTHPYFYLKEFGLVSTDRAETHPIVIEDDVWLGHGALIMPSCHRVSRGAVVAAGSVVMKDVPPYAIVSGMPAKLVRYRFAPEVIEAIEATQWWLLDKPELEAALRQAPEFGIAPSRQNASQFLRALGRPELPEIAAPTPPAPFAASPTSSSAAGLVLELLQHECPDLTAADMGRPIVDLKIDSFGFINLRIAIEAAIDRQIPDAEWGKVRVPADLVGIVAARGSAEAARPAAPTASPSAPAEEVLIDVSRPASERRIQHMNMPQMALSGLSEPWLFKEIGDMHWSVLTRGLQTPSSAVVDSEGDRLYATFTRICLSSDQPLTDIAENDRVTLDLEMERFGAGMFFSNASLTGPHGSVRAQIMTSFSKFGEAGSNTSLLKGQPVIPDGCGIKPLATLPTFAEHYRARRAADLPPPMFECEYEIQPPNDINGVGLLYFATYPTIVDLGAMRHFGRGLFSDFSTTFRDVYYFANCGPSETLIFRIHGVEEGDEGIRFDATLSRKSDGKVMAFVSTHKAPTAATRQARPAEGQRDLAAPK